MPTYTWSGINHYGKKIGGTNQARNYQQLKTGLIAQNILPLKITSNFVLSLCPHYQIKTKHITHLIGSLATLIGANIPIIKALTIISQDEPNPRLKDLIIDCQNSILNGKSLYQTMKQYPQYFPELFCSLINVGEQSGLLDIILYDLTNHIKKVENQKQKIIKALLYPLTILSIALIVTIILLLLVIPQFEIMFNNFGAKLPGYTQFIINLSKLLQTTWQIILSLIIGLIISAKIIYKRQVKFRHFLDKLYLRIPLVKTILTYAIIARLTKTLSLILKSGVPLLSAINIAITTITNWRYQLAMENATKLITNGKTLHQALTEQKLLPNRVIQLIALGEETGKLELMLEKISLIYNEALNNLTDNLNNTLEPIIMLSLGVIVGGLVIGMYLPIFRLGTII